MYMYEIYAHQDEYIYLKFSYILKFCNEGDSRWERLEGEVYTQSFIIFNIPGNIYIAIKNYFHDLLIEVVV